MQLLKTPHHVRAAGRMPAPSRGQRRSVRTLLALFSVAALTLIGAATADARSGTSSAQLCAYHESTTRNGLVVTSTFHVVQNNCQVSLVSLEFFATSSALVDTDTGTFNASETRYTLTVDLKCGTDTATDLELGPPQLFPPAQFDLQATSFRVACPPPGGSSGGAPAAAAAPAAAPAAAAAAAPAPALLSVSSPADEKATRTSWTSTPLLLTACDDKRTMVKGKCVVRETAKHTTSKPASAKKNKKQHADVEKSKKKHTGVLGARRSKALPFTK